MYKHLTAILIVFTFMLCSCDPPQKPIIHDEGEYPTITVEVIREMGSTSEDHTAYIPQIFNSGVAAIGELTHNFIIIGPQLKKGKSVEVHILGSVKVRESDQLKTYIISQSTDPKLALDVLSFDDFATRHSSIKAMISLYLNNYQGLGKTEVLSWDNQYNAMRIIDDIPKRKG